jgi:hypothetical protein
VLEGEPEQLALLADGHSRSRGRHRAVKLIILPRTPALELAAAINVGFRPKPFAVTSCRLPNRALAEVSLPVGNTPSHPMNVPTKVAPPSSAAPIAVATGIW